MGNAAHRNGHSREREKWPHNGNAEASILGGVILHNEVLGLISDVEVEDFFDHKHKVVFQAIRNLEHAKRPIDIVTLEVEIQKQGKLEAIGGVTFLGELVTLVPTAENVRHYADEVRLHRRNRDAIVVIGSALERAKTWPHDIAELVPEIRGELQRLEQTHQSSSTRTLHWTMPTADYLGSEEPSDDDAEDWVMRDLIPRGEPFLLGGPAKSGKTWTVLDMMVALALGDDWLKFTNTLGRPARVIGIFREDGKRRLHKRPWELARARGLSFRHPWLDANLRISREPIYLPDSRDERRLIEEAKAFKADVIFVDNLTRVMLGASNDEKDFKAFAQSWGRIGDETGAAVGFLHHVRKASGDGRQGGDPFEALRGAGDILGFARHAIVVSPRRDDGEKVSEVRMRGNLDLRREGFVMSFERRHVDGKWRAAFTDRGDIETSREEAASAKKNAKEEIAKQSIQDRLGKQIAHAVELAKKNGHVTRMQVAIAFGKSSDNTVKPAFEEALARGVLVKCTGSEKNLGYRLPNATQKGLPV